MVRGFRDDDDRDEGVTIKDVEAIGESELAVLCMIEGESRWIPKSQIRGESEVWENGHSGKLVITQWLAEREGLA